MNTSSNDLLLLIDASSYLYRAYHVLSALKAPCGMPTGAMYGVLNMLKSLLNRYPTREIGVIFDAPGGKGSREKRYSEYKSHRPVMPATLQAQLEPLYAMIRAIGLPLIIVPDVEADDVIGTLALRAQKKQQSVIISTGDKDMVQLVSPHVTLINTMTNQLTTTESVLEKYGFEPKQMIDFLALMGDASDNIPGIPGIGVKTATTLLQRLGSLENIYQQLEAVANLPIRGASRLARELGLHKEMAYLSYELATIQTDLQLPDTVDPHLVRTIADTHTLRSYFERFAFTSFLRELDKGRFFAHSVIHAPDLASEELNREERASPAMPVQYELILELAQWKQWLQRLQQAPYFSLDVETDGLDPITARLVGISIAYAPQKAAYIPFAHEGTEVRKQLALEDVLSDLRPILADAKPPAIFQNLKFDQAILEKYGIEFNPKQYDTLLMSYLLNSTLVRHALDSLAKKYLDYEMTTYASVVGKGVYQRPFQEIDLEIASHYAAEDADITLRLYEHLSPQLARIPASQQLFEALEMPLVPVLMRMERYGVLVDIAALNELSDRFGSQLIELEAAAHSLAGGPFNLASSQQLAVILFEKQGLPIIKKTATGAASTSEQVLTVLAEQHPLPKTILEYRTIAKLKSTYTDALPKQVHPVTGRIHTSYHQAVTATGRLSSSNPNLQNIPIRDPKGQWIRNTFIAAPGSSILSVDYSQIELRIMAHLSGDPGLIRAFLAGEDIHATTASELFNVPLTSVTPEQRRHSKAINFGLIYGMSAFGLSQQLQLSRYEAQVYIDSYFERYPKVLAYMTKMREYAADYGYVETLFGRRLWLPDIHSQQAAKRRAAERAAINGPMQGTAADLIKRAMVAIDKVLLKEDGAHMVMQIHDELVFEVTDDAVCRIQPVLETCLINSAQLKVPLKVNSGVGKTWGQAH